MTWPEVMTPAEREAAQLVELEHWLAKRTRPRALEPEATPAQPLTFGRAVCRDCQTIFERPGPRTELCEACWLTMRQRVAAQMRARAFVEVVDRLQAQAESVEHAIIARTSLSGSCAPTCGGKASPW